MIPARPLPRLDADSKPFWDGCKDGRLLGQRCGACGAWRWLPREHCPDCHSAEPVWESLRGTGRIVGLASVRRPFDPRFGHVPLDIVHVQVDGTDGRMVLTTSLPAGAWRHAAVGAAVIARFTTLPDGFVLPTFTLHTDPQE